jgi:hypothetical protein
VLDGFRYRRLAEAAPTDAAFRRNWLARQRPAHLDAAGFRPDPWRQAIKVLRRMGHPAEAAALAVGRENWLRDIGRIGTGQPRVLRRLARLGHRVFGWVAGYGHRPVRLLVWTAAVWLACASVYQLGAAEGVQAPAPHPLLYSAQRLVPMLDLLQGRPLDAVPAESPWHAWLYALMVLEGLLGWAAGLTLVATLAGWADRDRRR